MPQKKPKPKLSCKTCKKPIHDSEVESGFELQDLERLSFEGDPPIDYVIGHWPKDLFAHYHGYALDKVIHGWADHMNGEVCPCIYFHDVPALPPAVGSVPITYAQVEQTDD